MPRKIECPKCQHSFHSADDEVDLAAAPPDSDASWRGIEVRSQSSPCEAPSKAGSRRYTSRGILFRVLLVTLLLVAAWFVPYGVRTWLYRDTPATAQALPSSDLREINSPRAIDVFKDVSPTANHAKAVGFLSGLDQSVVQLHAVGVAGDPSLGTGFVIDKTGLVATSYHVVAHSTQVYAEFQSGERCKVLGFAAVEPERDLAIVRLETTPLRMTPIPMAGEEPRQLAPVVAVGHPNGLAFSPYDGKVSRVVQTSQLPLHSQRFLQQLLTGNVDATWIQHTARLSDGNSGGPLLDEEGQVIGVNTWVDRQTQFSYALHVKHLRKLLGRATSQTRPLGSVASEDSWVKTWLDDLSSEKMRILYDELSGIGFQPSSPQDYRELQKLAWAVTVANASHSLTLGPEREEQFAKLEAEADRVVAKLRERRWDGPGQILLINEFAARQIDEPLSGVFLIGTLMRFVEGGDGSSGALLRISGTDRPLFVPLVDRLFRAPQDASILVLGVNYNGREVRFGENPLQLESAPVIVSGALIRLDDPD